LFAQDFLRVKHQTSLIYLQSPVLTVQRMAHLSLTDAGLDALEDAIHERALQSATSDRTARRKIEGMDRKRGLNFVFITLRDPS